MTSANYNIASIFYQRFILAPFGLDRDNAIVLWMLLLFGGIALGGLYYYDGNVPLVAGILYLTGIFFLSFLRLDYSFFLLMFSVMIFDQYGIPGFAPLTAEVGFFNNLKEIPYVPFFDAGVMSPLEIHIFFICSSLLIQMSINREYQLNPVPVWIPFLFFFSCFIFSFVHGMRGGGDFLVALWEVRALFYLCTMFLIVPQIVHTKSQLNTLVWVFIIGISFKAIQGVGRFINLGFTTGGYDVLTNHEDAVFIVTLLLLLLGLVIFKVKNRQRLWLILLLIPLLLGFYVAQRRASYASLMVSIVTLIVLLPVVKRIVFLQYFLPILFGILVYGFLFWNSSSTIATPVQMVKSGIEKPDRDTNYRDYYSNLYREFENYNLAHTVTNNPVLGTGFGKKYDQPIPLIDIRFPLRDYIPHNEIIWVLVKMGGVGFLAFWFFFNSFVAKGTQVFLRLRDPYLKAITLVIVIAVINQMVVSYFDLQLTYSRNMIYLGCLMGLLPVVEKADRTSTPVELTENGEENE